ncbi:MAG TPA: PCRF domain-containing protein, partial [Methylomirabilota bacterium]
MFDKLRQLEERYAELHRRLSEPQVIGQASEYARIAKAAAELSEVVEKFGDYKGVLQRLSEARHIV